MVNQPAFAGAGDFGELASCTFCRFYTGTIAFDSHSDFEDTIYPDKPVNVRTFGMVYICDSFLSADCICARGKYSQLGFSGDEVCRFCDTRISSNLLLGPGDYFTSGNIYRKYSALGK